MDQFPNKDMLALIRSPAGQALISMLQQQNPQTLEKAKQMAQSGNYSGVQGALESLLRDPRFHSLMKQLGGDQHE